MLVLIRYNASRFPRVVSLQGGATKSFQHDRKVLELDEYDAMRLLRNNSRITPTKWEFSVIGIKGEHTTPERVVDGAVNAPEEEDTLNKEELPAEDSVKPKAKGKGKK